MCAVSLLMRKLKVKETDDTRTCSDIEFTLTAPPMPLL